MSNVTNHKMVSENYKNQENLVIRANLHQKYDKKRKWSRWIFDNYHFFEGCKILEVGCGNGSMWEGNIESLPTGTTLTLTDFTQGMVDVTKSKFESFSNVTVEQMNIQDIHFEDNSFDIIIANSMLYHIPNLSKAISEVYRVLKPGGIFYCTTFGVNGQQKFFKENFRKFNPNITVYENETYPFVMQNGYEILSEKFHNIIRYDYIDSLDVTDAKDITDYVLSTVKMATVPEEETVGLLEYFESIKDENGIINVPREYCTFISQKNI